jgi:hypothetical protein
MKGDEIVVKKSGAEVPGCSLYPENPPKNRHQRLFLEFSVSTLSARHTVLVVSHDHSGTTSRTELLCKGSLAAFDSVTGGPAD